MISQALVDLVVSYRNAMVLRCEQKSSDREMETAKFELTDKLSEECVKYFPRGYNSIFGITSCRDVICVHEIRFEGKGKGFRSYDMKYYSISNANDRVNFILDLFNIIRWIRSIEGPNEYFHLPLDIKVPTPNGHTVCWNGTVIEKAFKKGTNKEVVKRIKKVYENNLEHVEWGSVSDRARSHITITRIGIPLSHAVKGLVSKADAISHVQLGLAELHNIGFAHCDLRVDNCFFDQQTKCVFIDDLEYITPLNYPAPAEVSIPENWKPSNAEELDKLMFTQFCEQL